MIYRSNIIAPDLTPHFKHLQSRELAGYSFGHDVLSDWGDKSPDDPVFGLYAKCGFWSHDEAAILYAIGEAKPGRWLDIGAHTGWTTAHLAAAGCYVVCLEPMSRLEEWSRRIEENLVNFWNGVNWISYLRSDEYFATEPPFAGVRHRYRGVVIDGDHEWGHPKADALGAHHRLADDGVILFHDGMGGPTWEGVYALLDLGYRCHVYLTPQIVMCCYNDEYFTPPVHVPDPKIDWREIQTNHMKDFAWGRVTVDKY